MQIIVDGLLTSYHVQGQGKKVLLLHGWADSSKSFENLSNQLSKLYKVIAIDLPGFGGTQTPNGDWGLDEYGKYLQSFLAKIGDVDIFAVIGHSNGGAIALRSVHNGTLHPKKLILLASSGIRNKSKPRKRALMFGAKIAKAITFPLPATTKDKLKKQAYTTIGSDLYTAKHMQGTFKKIISDDVLEDARHISIPTLLIYGTDDTATPPQFGKMLQDKIKHSQLNVLDHATHFVHHDAPKEVNELIERFLK